MGTAGRPGPEVDDRQVSTGRLQDRATRNPSGIQDDRALLRYRLVPAEQ